MTSALSDAMQLGRKALLPTVGSQGNKGCNKATRYSTRIRTVPVAPRGACYAGELQAVGSLHQVRAGQQAGEGGKLLAGSKLYEYEYCTVALYIRITVLYGPLKDPLARDFLLGSTSCGS